MKKSVIIVNGYPRAGKDQFIDFILENIDLAGYFVRARKHSTIDKVVEIAKMIGYDGVKTKETRQMLSELKDFYTKWFDGPFEEIKDIILNQVDVLLVGIREPSEIRKTVKWCRENDIRVMTILVTGKREERDHSSHSDSLVEKYPYNNIIHNDGTLDEYKLTVQKFFDNNLRYFAGIL